MSKAWHAYALHVLDAIAKVRRIQERGNLVDDEMLYDAALRNLQTLSEATQMLPHELKLLYPAAIAGVINTHLQPLEACIKAMLAAPDLK